MPVWASVLLAILPVTTALAGVLITNRHASNMAERVAREGRSAQFRTERRECYGRLLSTAERYQGLSRVQHDLSRRGADYQARVDAELSRLMETGMNLWNDIGTLDLIAPADVRRTAQAIANAWIEVTAEGKSQQDFGRLIDDFRKAARVDLGVDAPEKR